MEVVHVFAIIFGLVGAGTLPPQNPHLTQENVDAKIAWLMDEVNDLRTRQNAVEEENKQLKRAINAIQKGKRYVAPGNPNSDAVAFYAILTRTMRDIGVGQTVIFDNLVTNEGTGYNPTTGVFTCKDSGVYVFFLNIMTHAGKYVEVEIVKNGVAFMAILTEDDSRHDNGSNLGIVNLDVGDNVWARVHWHVTSDNGDIIYPKRSTFSGFLLQAI